jgi:hypothetical protein
MIKGSKPDNFKYLVFAAFFCHFICFLNLPIFKTAKVYYFIVYPYWSFRHEGNLFGACPKVQAILFTLFFSLAKTP